MDFLKNWNWVLNTYKYGFKLKIKNKYEIFQYFNVGLRSHKMNRITEYYKLLADPNSEFNV